MSKVHGRDFRRTYLTHYFAQLTKRMGASSVNAPSAMTCIIAAAAGESRSDTVMKRIMILL